MLTVGAGGGCLDIFSLVYHFSILSSSLWETVRYRLKYCLEGPLSPKQPTNQLSRLYFNVFKLWFIHIIINAELEDMQKTSVTLGGAR